MRAPTDSLPCACSALRKATRAIARIYDGELRQAGLTTTQFSILRALERHGGPAPLSRLAEELVMERTSLYRALVPLRLEHLVALSGTPGRRAKTAALTARGRRRIADALPHWHSAQNAFLEQFGRTEWGRLAGELTGVVQAAQTIG